MAGVVQGAVALLVGASIVFYFGIMAVLLLKLAVEGEETRRLLGVPLLPSFFQNFGIPIVLLGFTLQTTEVILAGAAMIGTGVLLKTESSISLHPNIEAPLLGLACLTLAAVGLFYGLV